jgi:hypothetical protein
VALYATEQGRPDGSSAELLANSRPNAPGSFLPDAAVFDARFEALKEPVRVVKRFSQGLQRMLHVVNEHLQSRKNFLHDVKGDF